MPVGVHEASEKIKALAHRRSQVGGGDVLSAANSNLLQDGRQPARANAEGRWIALVGARDRGPLGKGGHQGVGVVNMLSEATAVRLTVAQPGAEDVRVEREVSAGEAERGSGRDRVVQVTSVTMSEGGDDLVGGPNGGADPRLHREPRIALVQEVPDGTPGDLGLGGSLALRPALLHEFERARKPGGPALLGVVEALRGAPVHPVRGEGLPRSVQRLAIPVRPGDPLMLAARDDLGVVGECQTECALRELNRVRLDDPADLPLFVEYLVAILEFAHRCPPGGRRDGRVERQELSRAATRRYNPVPPVHAGHAQRRPLVGARVVVGVALVRHAVAVPATVTVERLRLRATLQTLQEQVALLRRQGGQLLLDSASGQVGELHSSRSSNVAVWSPSSRMPQ